MGSCVSGPEYECGAAPLDPRVERVWGMLRADDVAGLRQYGLARVLKTTRPHGVSTESPLMAAAGAGATGAVEALLEAGCDPAAQNSVGWNALHAAAAQGRENTLALLLEACGLEKQTYGRRRRLRPSRRSGKHKQKPAPSCGPLDAVTADGETPLTLALWNAYYDAARLMCDYGARFESARPITGDMLLRTERLRPHLDRLFTVREVELTLYEGTRMPTALISLVAGFITQVPQEAY